MTISEFRVSDLLIEAPFPVAYTLRRAREVRDQVPHARILAWLDVLEASIRWNAVLVLSAYRSADFFDRSFNGEILASLSRKLSLGDWMYLTRRGMKAFERSDRPFPLVGFKRVWTRSRGSSRLVRLMDDLITERNSLIHGGLPDGDVLKSKAVELEKHIGQVLSMLAPAWNDHTPVGFPADYSLPLDPLVLTGASTDFFGREYLLDSQNAPSPHGSVFLVSRDSPKSHLRLSPFAQILPGQKMALLSRLRFSREDLPIPAFRTFSPAGEQDLERDVLELTPDLNESLVSIRDGLRRKTRLLTDRDLNDLEAVRVFSSLGPELQERRNIFVGRNPEQLRIREWIERLDSPFPSPAVCVVTGIMGQGKRHC